MLMQVDVLYLYLILGCREYYNVLFTGLRVLIGGNVIGGYYGPNGFG